MRAYLALALGTMLLAGCPAGFPDLCDNGACDSDASLDGSGDVKADGPATCPSGKEPKDDATCVTDAYGVFLAPAPSGNDANDGSKAHPVATLKTALQKVGSKSFIFVCTGTYSESVDIQQTASIFGGFDCTNWAYAATNAAKFVGTKPDYVFGLSVANNTVIGDLELDAIDGAANTGQSSIGAFVVNSSGVKLERMTIRAGKGADGAPGTLAQFNFPAQVNGNNADAGAGGGSATQSCPGGSTSVGGAGGDIGADGKDGTPALDGGLHGDAGVAMNLSCTNGGNGANGAAGGDGVGAATFGDVTDAGWIPQRGADGKTGQPGQGGGGGGGQVWGASSGGGGGGGAGACGGAGGGGGGGGGASIALLTIGAVLNVTNTTCICATGGNAGSGVAGQGGSQSAGAKGSGVLNGCSGGIGGVGGNGGGGGGGAGGLSVGIVSKGGTVTLDQFTQAHIATGAAGLKGAGAVGNDGIAGIADASLAL